MRTSKYSSYRGRSPWKSFFKALAVIVIILVVLAGAVALYVQQYLVVSSDGVRLDLPFFVQETPSPVEPPSVPVSNAPIVIVTPTPDPEPTPTPTPIAPVSLPQEALYDGTALSQMAAAGGDCALFDMKDDNGALSYVSSIELAQYTKQTSTNEALNFAIQSLNKSEGLYTIARVSCFKDHNITDYERSLSIFTNSDYRWTDPDGIRWISPTNPNVQTYITEICVELAELGFDEIILDNAGYPTQGNLHYIKKGAAYNSDQFSTVIDNFYAQVSSALTDYDIVLSAVTTQDALTGQDTLSGQTPENLAHFDRLWVINETGTLSLYSDK